MAALQTREVDLAFAASPDLRKRVHAAIDQNPAQSTLFRDISTYILNRASESAASEPASKKRKLQESTQNGAGGPAGRPGLTDTSVKALKTYPAVSFSCPQRKKLTLELLSGKDGGGIRALSADGSFEFGIAWRDVEQVFCLPVPAKQKRQHNFIVFPFHGDGVNPAPDGSQGLPPPEPIQWTFEEPTGKNVIEGEDPGPGPIADAINQCLAQAGVRKTVVFPDATEFASATREVHRPKEHAFHVKAHRGSKEGFLYFTAVGIVYGFKKPLLFFDFATINAISYTDIVRDMFNLVITTPHQEIEFGMLPQTDFEGINAYVQAHGLQDASMAAERRARKLNINPPAETNGHDQGGTENGEPSELEKAARLLEQQAEDEDEEDDEDFDPGSEGESEGSGSDSEDEQADGEGEGFEGQESGHAYEDGYDYEDEAEEL